MLYTYKSISFRLLITKCNITEIDIILPGLCKSRTDKQLKNI